MNSGKTEACLAVIQQLVRKGLVVAAAKATGVSLRRDILGMEDAGASETMIFTDLGTVTTGPANAAQLTKTMLNRLSRNKPDVIVLELGDGLIGEYGVSAILNDKETTRTFRTILLAASDPVGALGGVSVLRERHGLEPTVVTGPATDNNAGTRLIGRETNVPAINARLHADVLSQMLLNSMETAGV